MEGRKTESELNDDEKCFMKAFKLSGLAKLTGLFEYLESLIESGVKFLIFAHHMDVIDGIENEIKWNGVEYVRIDGSVAPDKWPFLVQWFQEDESC